MQLTCYVFQDRNYVFWIQLVDSGPLHTLQKQQVCILKPVDH